MSSNCCAGSSAGRCPARGDFRSGRTPYDKLAVTLRISEGIVAVEDVSVEGPAVRVAVAGTASVPAREFDLKGTASLLNATERGGLRAALRVQGPWDDPFMLPDAQSLIRRSGATAPLLDALRDRRPAMRCDRRSNGCTGARRPGQVPGRSRRLQPARSERLSRRPRMAAYRQSIIIAPARIRHRAGPVTRRECWRASCGQL